MARSKKKESKPIALIVVSAIALLLAGILISQAFMSSGGGLSFLQKINPALPKIAPGQQIRGRLQSGLSSGINNPGDIFYLALSSPIYKQDGEVFASPGAQLIGEVTSVLRAAKAGKPGSLDMQLTSVKADDGKEYRLSSRLDKSQFYNVASGGTGSHVAKRTAVGAAGGALFGLTTAALSNQRGHKRLGRNTAVGTGLGAGAGLATGALTRGHEFSVGSGTSIPFVLEGVLSVI